jgi:UDP-N-acetylglucosamine--N-acetylmuramyl-(pentapeptide) pyrophosphoryl-undecaprenol N-acetylglucosamine transferase
MVFESNAIPGRVVRLLAPFVDCVQLQWPIAARRLRARRVLISGNPVRPDVLQHDRRSARIRLGLYPDRCTLLAMGGSQGALALNEALVQALRTSSEEGLLLPHGLQVLHLTGSEHLEEVQRQSLPPGLRYRTRAFLSRMQDAYAAADLVLARAGGATLAELTASALPSILVPYPYATENHQAANAAVLAEAGAAVVLSQRKLTPRKLGKLIAGLVNHPDRRQAMAARARALGRPDAASVVAAELASMAGFEAPSDRNAVPWRRSRTIGSQPVPRAA